MPLYEGGLLWPLVVVIFLLGLGIGLGVILILGKTSRCCRFSWQRLLANNVFISYIDKDNENWTVEILYNNEINKLMYDDSDRTNIKISIPSHYTKDMFIKLINQIPTDSNACHVMLKGLLDSRTLKKLGFTSKDLLMFREFKNYLLLGVLKN